LSARRTWLGIFPPCPKASPFVSRRVPFIFLDKSKAACVSTIRAADCGRSLVERSESKNINFEEDYKDMTSKIVKQVTTLTCLGALATMAALLMSCGNSTPKVNTTPKFLVAPDQTAGAHVNVFTIAADGTLTAVASSPQDMGVTGVEPVVIDPIKNDILFAADINDGMIRSWSIDSAGKLTTIDTTAAASPSTGVGNGDGAYFYRRDALAVSPDGKCLYSALGNPHVGAFQIGSDNKFTARS
jgi:hypothetical protein